MERLRRTMLFIPGGNEKMLTKALGLDVDSLIIDLEDSVALEKKAFSREAAAEALIALDFGEKEKVVRINSLSTEYGRPDMEVVVKGKPDTLLFPKVSRSEDVIGYDITLAIIKVTSGYKFQTAAYRTDVS
jgi:citrate lyase subunit beta/citryl-CoA lyase